MAIARANGKRCSNRRTAKCQYISEHEPLSSHSSQHHKMRLVISQLERLTCCDKMKTLMMTLNLFIILGFYGGDVYQVFKEDLWLSHDYMPWMPTWGGYSPYSAINKNDEEKAGAALTIIPGN